jgi:hypothetical protein
MGAHPLPRDRRPGLTLVEGLVIVGIIAILTSLSAPAGGVNPRTGYATGSYAANYLVFSTVEDHCVSVNAQGMAKIPGSSPEGVSQTILFAEKFAMSQLAPSIARRESLHRGAVIGIASRPTATIRFSRTQRLFFQ